MAQVLELWLLLFGHLDITLIVVSGQVVLKACFIVAVSFYRIEWSFCNDAMMER